MLHLIPPGLHRIALRLAHGLRKRWWRLRRPRLLGVRVLALDHHGRVLLVRHSYGSADWMPPGGGVKRGESPLLAGARELAEETGCVLAEARLVAEIDEYMHGARHHVSIVAGRATTPAKADGREIAEAGWFDPAALPQPLGRRLDRDLPDWLSRYSEQL